MWFLALPHSPEPKHRFRQSVLLLNSFTAEERGLVKAVQSLGVACAVGQFVEGCGVVFSSRGELRHMGQGDAVGRGAVEGSVALF